MLCCTDETDEQIEKRIEENPLGFAREALQREEANEQVQQAYRDVTTRAREVHVPKPVLCFQLSGLIGAVRSSNWRIP